MLKEDGASRDCPRKARRGTIGGSPKDEKEPRMKRVSCILMAAGCLLAAGPAQAHFSLDFPKSRSGEIDTSPCGPAGSTRGSTVTTFRPGETITLQWQVVLRQRIQKKS